MDEAAREHFRRVAELEHEMELRRLSEAGRRSPGENIERALRWSDGIIQAFGVPDEPWDPPSLRELWNRRRATP